VGRKKRRFPLLLLIALATSSTCHFAKPPANAVAGLRCGGAALLGIDVSAYQTKLDWDEVSRRRGMRFAIAKASQADRADPLLARHVAAMREQRLVVGMYHLVENGTDGVTQANAMWAAIQAAGGLAKGDLPPAIDVEGDEIDRKVVAAFARRIRALSGRTPLLYSNACGLTAMRQDPDLAALPTWLAAPSGESCFPTVELCADVGSPVFWQWSWGDDQPAQHTDLAGGYYDSDFFLGDARALAAFIAGSR
jgi:GH25 family lysozyme M1 (1,4-beta-N-acetylmuramidase)